jgi:AbrB family looped-hinge helix DNA binding protein
MKVKVKLDKAGRLRLPKSIREALQIRSGATLEVEIEGDGLAISPVRARPGLQSEQGIWVFRSDSAANVSIPDLIDRQREQRMRATS